jgi:hypothetical protein
MNPFADKPLRIDDRVEEHKTGRIGYVRRLGEEKCLVHFPEGDDAVFYSSLIRLPTEAEMREKCDEIKAAHFEAKRKSRHV